MRRILSLGGGGIKGATTAAYLAHMEEVSGRAVVDCFDLIAGTSTGGILAIALAMRVPASDLVEFYRQSGPEIFPRDRSTLDGWWSLWRHLRKGKYSAAPLARAVDNVLSQRQLGNAETRLVIPATQPARAEMYLFKTRHHALFQRDHRLLARDVALATSAAPSYLPQHQSPKLGLFADGGLWANNPVGIAVSEAVSYLDWDPNDLHVLSIETPQEAQVIPDGGATEWISGPRVLARTGNLQSTSARGTALALMRDVGRLPSPGRMVDAITGGFPAGYFNLDQVGQIEALLGAGYSEARKQTSEVVGRFFSETKERFVAIPMPAV